MARLFSCRSCAELVPAGTCVCPHCGAGGVCRASSLPASALLLGLSLAACDDDSQQIIQPLYGPAATDIDYDGDGWSEDEGDCDETDDTIHPEAEETPGDGVDSNCDGDDDT